MAKIGTLKRNGDIVYPKSVTPAIKDKKRNKAIDTILDDIDNDISSVSSKITTLSSDVTSAKSDIVNIKTNITSLQTKDTSLQSDINNINNNITTIKSDISKTKSDIVTIKSDIIEVNENNKLINDITTLATVGTLAAGSTISKGTDVRDMLNAMVAFKTPIFSVLEVGNDSVTYNSSQVIFCNSTPITFTKVNHCETNIDNIKNKQVTLNINGTISTETAVAIKTTLNKSATFNISAKSVFTISLIGKNSLGANMSTRTLSITCIMPAYFFVTANTTEATIKSTLISAIADSGKYIGSHTIDKNITVSDNGCWCVAMPPHLVMESIGTKGDYDMKVQKTTTDTVIATRTVNGVVDVSYTIYLLPFVKGGTYNVRFMTKAK